MRETDEGLYVEGRLDLTDSEVAREAWRSMKSNGVALSFGYKVDRSHKGSDGVTLLDELDLFEVSVTPGPANPETRFLSLKAALAVPVTHPVPTNAELLAYAKRLGVEPPVPSSRLRRHGDDTAFAVALGETRGSLAKRVAEQPPSKAPNTREQRRRADDERLAMALGEAPPQAKDTVVRIDDDYVKTKSESYRRMLAVLQGDN